MLFFNLIPYYFYVFLIFCDFFRFKIHFLSFLMYNKIKKRLQEVLSC